MLLSERLAQAFALGAVRQPLVRAASGWGGHNQVFRLETASGTWAVKRHGRPGIAPSTATVAIETAAFAGGVPMPRPALTADGRCWVQIDGLPYRCHEWIDGTTKENEVTSATEAEAMGRIVAHLHGLAIEVSQPDRPDGPDLEGILEPVVAAANGTEALMCLVDAHAVFERRIAAIAFGR